MRLSSSSEWLLLTLGWSLLFLATAVDAQPARGPASLPQPGIDVQDYDFELTLSDETDRIEGTATVRVRITTDTLTAVRLDLVGPPNDAEHTGMRVSSVREGGQSVSYRQAGDILRIRSQNEFTAGQTHTYHIRYGGVPGDGLIIGTNRHGDRTFFGDNWPNRARHWLPVVDHLSDKATVEFRVTAPSRYEVVSNGVLVTDSTMGKTRVTHWKSQVPLPPKVMVIGVANFAIDTAGTVDGVPVQSWVYPEDREVGFEDLGQAPPILQFFEERLGPYPYEKLANVQSATRYGGMENAAAIFYSEQSVADGEDSRTLLAHEIAHQWFGNTVTESDWPHLWLSEGFATYLAGLYLQHVEGSDRLVSYMKDARQNVIDFHEKNPNEPLVDTTFSDPNELLNTNPYRKGAWVLHMLRQKVGTDTFWAGLRAYYNRYRHQNASTENFRMVMEDISGEDLTHFFNQWTRRPGHPVIEGSWRYDESAGECLITFRQTQNEAPFRIPLDLTIQGSSSSMLSVHLQDRTEQVRLDCAEAPSSIVLDPNTRLLAEFSMTHSK